MKKSEGLIRSLFFIAAVLTVLSTFTATAATAQVEVRTLKQDLVLDGARKVHVNLSVGDVTIEGTAAGNNVEIEMFLDCNRQDLEICKTRANRVRLAPRMSGGVLKIRLKKTPRARLRGIQARMKIRMPSTVPLEVDVKSGGVYVTGLKSHLNIDVGAGDVDILGFKAGTALVNVDNGLGKADLWLGDSRVEGSGWPKSLDWRGSGQAEIRVVGIGSGDVSIRLE